MGVKGHFQSVVITGKTPWGKPVGQGNMKGYLIEFMKFSVNKKAVFCPLRKIRPAVAYAKT
jgi:hypothetical protein